jgi:hypothetical protein
MNILIQLYAVLTMNHITNLQSQSHVWNRMKQTRWMSRFYHLESSYKERKKRKKRKKTTKKGAGKDLKFFFFLYSEIQWEHLTKNKQTSSTCFPHENSQTPVWTVKGEYMILCVYTIPADLLFFFFNKTRFSRITYSGK